MNLQIPEGTTIGEIEASLEWLLSHTTRFLGAILVRIYTGEGFILIEYGRPVGFFFRMGDRILKGAAARQFFGQQEFMNACLRRYTDEEFKEALATTDPETLVMGAREEAAGPEIISVAETRDTLFEERQGAAGPTPAQVPAPAGIDPTLPEDGRVPGVPGRTEHAASVQAEETFEERTPESVLDRIFGAPGVIAAAIFREGSIVDSRGETLLGILVQPAEGILLSAWEVLALLSTGRLVQVTLRLSGRNVTIAPSKEGYLLVLTGQEVNLGQIRKLVHDALPAGRE
jgi:predicted regulator of Ras-like GTPase activity (Roadblock/LC7/MglB family)